MRINHNIPALRSYNQLSKTNNALDKSLERLSSGLRINRASDDAAGLAISQKMDAQVTGLQQASRNALDGVSLIQTAEGALSEVHEMLKRIRQLSLQVSNGTYTPEDRKTAQKEVDSLMEEVDRISTDIEFNEKKLLNGEIDRRAYPESTKFTVKSLSDTVTPGAYKLTVIADATNAQVIGKLANNGSLGLSDKIGEAGNININGEEIEILATDTAAQVFDKIRDLSETIGAEVISVNATLVPTTFKLDGTTSLKLDMKQFGSEFGLTINASNGNLLSRLGLDVDISGNPVKGIKILGTDVKATIDSTSDFSGTATVIGKGSTISIRDINGFEMKVATSVGTAATTPTTTINVLDAGPLRLQIGANEGQTMTIGIPNMSANSLGIDAVNITTVEGAQSAISYLDEAINMVSDVRAKLGAYQNRLEYTVSNLNVAAENLTESLSRIEDIDMALEMSEYTQKNVLAQAGTSMLAQANQRPQTVLQLLQN
ncbi:MAG: hypothetical protein K0R15_997 [Clostridiales bacterium]|jgi:flagellin|nr:hypothetical protein [Clostridiales bacterium]